MRMLITGANGQLGQEIIRSLDQGKTRFGLPTTHIEYRGASCKELDITDLKHVNDYLSYNQFDAVVNCASMTNVDECEINIDQAFLVNSIGARNLAIASEHMNIKLLHVSSDYVFDGEKEVPYMEWDLPNPQNIYGKSKLLSEEYVRLFCRRSFVVRTAWLYGHTGRNFIKTILKLARETGKLTVVTDQCGSLTNASELAHHIIALLSTEEYGTYHATGNGHCSWYDVACQTVEFARIQAEITPCLSHEYPNRAKRPPYSVLDNLMLRNTIGDQFQDWKIALKEYIDGDEE